MHLRKGERNISFVCQVLEIYLQESPRLDLKNPLPPIPKGSKAPGVSISLKRRIVTLAVHPSTWEVATLESEFLGILGVFLVLLCCVMELGTHAKKLEFLLLLAGESFLNLFHGKHNNCIYQYRHFGIQVVHNTSPLCGSTPLSHKESAIINPS